MNRSTTLFECSGHATVALECSLKRQRTPEKFAAIDTVFDFDSVFDSISEETEAFPSLAWPADDEDNYVLLDPFESRKRIRSDVHSGLKRTKALASDLSTLDATEAITQITPLNKLHADHKLPSHSRHQLPFSTSVNMARCC